MNKNLVIGLSVTLGVLLIVGSLSGWFGMTGKVIYENSPYYYGTPQEGRSYTFTLDGVKYKYAVTNYVRESHWKGNITLTIGEESKKIHGYTYTPVEFKNGLVAYVTYFEDWKREYLDLVIASKPYPEYVDVNDCHDAMTWYGRNEAGLYCRYSSEVLEWTGTSIGCPSGTIPQTNGRWNYWFPQAKSGALLGQTYLCVPINDTWHSFPPYYVSGTCCKVRGAPGSPGEGAMASLKAMADETGEVLAKVTEVNEKGEPTTRDLTDEEKALILKQ
ncbi:hypothetical protein J4463_03135 [Candidatus Pacearchaeota archaeon]|nr:hypothetical protein [Candidatus Pacearchaeota archaeon]